MTHLGLVVKLECGLAKVFELGLLLGLVGGRKHLLQHGIELQNRNQNNIPNQMRENRVVESDNSEGKKTWKRDTHARTHAQTTHTHTKHKTHKPHTSKTLTDGAACCGDSRRAAQTEKKKSGNRQSKSTQARSTQQL